MKNLIGLSFCCLIFIMPFASYCQISGKVEYIAILESEDFKELESTLYFDDSESLFFVDAGIEELNNEGKDDIHIKDESNLIFELDFSLKKPKKYEVYISRETGNILSQRSIFKDLSTIPCILYESTGIIEWEIQEEFKNIGKLNSQKAIASFRGRNYTAWFTTEIPIEIGPWKFHGLPGLILEIVDSEKGVQFLFKSIKIPYDVGGKIVKPNDGELMSIDEFAEYEGNFSKELVNLFRAKMPRGMNNLDISFKEVIKSIEREY